MIIFRRVFFIMGLLYVYRALTFRHSTINCTLYSTEYHRKNLMQKRIGENGVGLLRSAYPVVWRSYPTQTRNISVIRSTMEPYLCKVNIYSPTGKTDDTIDYSVKNTCALMLPEELYIMESFIHTYCTYSIDKVFRVFLLAIRSHLYSFALRFLQTPATFYSFYSSVTIHWKGERRKTW